MAFSSKKSALEFGYGYMKLQREHWGGAEWMLRWQIFSETLKHALDKKIILSEDFLEYDRFVLKKLEESRDEEIKRNLSLLNNKLMYVINGERPDYFLRKKFRYIDPSYIERDKLLKLSENDEDYRVFLQGEREHNKKGIKISLA